MDLPEHGKLAYGAATVILGAEGGVLLVRHTYAERNWEIPGGLALPGEDPLTTARRELREETGLDLAPTRLAGVYFEASHFLGPFLHLVFRLDLAVTVAATPSSDEVDAAGFFPLDALPRPMSDFTERRIREARAGAAGFGVVQPRRWLV